MESLANRTLAANMTSFHVPHVEKNNKKTSKNKKRWTRVFIIIAERDISLFAYLCWISVVERCVCGAPIVQLTRTMPLTTVVLCCFTDEDFNVLTTSTHVISWHRTREASTSVLS